MDSIPLPSKIALDSSDEHRARIVIEPCYPGYGTTLGNALRRVLLSSLSGAAVTRVKIEGVTHEFTTLPGVKEDIVDVILNLKLLRVRLHEGEEAILTVDAKGEKVLTAKDIKVPSNVEVVNPAMVLATLTDKSAELKMEITVEKGRGYVPVEAKDHEKGEIGAIAVDAIYTPVKTVNFDTENVRVGQMTNYDRLTIDLATDGTITPQEAFHRAAEILVDHFTLFKNTDLGEGEKPATKRRTKKSTVKAEEGEKLANDGAEQPIVEK
ncbi:MAG: DNA-directed RNA polymerase subunit alpha [bacterium]